MIILLDTSTPMCRLTLIDGDRRVSHEWEAGRSLAKGLLGYLREHLAAESVTFADIKGIGVMKGPGSFTGLRIGLAVLNTLADAEHIPIVGEAGEEWQEKTLGRLNAGENDQIVLPFYGGEARITKPRK